MRLFQAALDTPLDNPFSATLSVHGLHFTVWRLRFFLFFPSSAFLSDFSSSAFLRGLFCLINFPFLCPSFFSLRHFCAAYLIFPIFFPLRHFCLAYFVLFFLIVSLFGISVWLILSYFSLFFSSSAFSAWLILSYFSFFFSSSAFLRDLFCLIFPYFPFLSPSFFSLRHFCAACFVLLFLYFFLFGISVWLILSYFSFLFSSSAFLCGLFCLIFPYYFPLRHFCVACFVLFFLIVSLFGISVWLICLIFPYFGHFCGGQAGRMWPLLFGGRVVGHNLVGWRQRPACKSYWVPIVTPSPFSQWLPNLFSCIKRPTAEFFLAFIGSWSCFL